MLYSYTTLNYFIKIISLINKITESFSALTGNFSRHNKQTYMLYF